MSLIAYSIILCIISPIVLFHSHHSFKPLINDLMHKQMATLRILLLLVVAVVLAQATVVPRTAPMIYRVLRTYKFQIKEDPKVNWAPVVRDFNDTLQRALELAELIPMSETFFDGVEHYAKTQFKYQDFVAQISAIADIGKLPFAKLFFLNFMYEFSTFKACSAVVARNSEGYVLHGRNLDFEMWELLSKLLVNIEYYDGEKKVFAIDHVVGSVFALTGERFGAFSINVNTRSEQHSIKKDFVSLLKDNAIPTVWLLRKVLEEETNFNDAIKRLENTEIGGPVYYIAAGVGPNEGIVIERSNNYTHAHYQLSEERWFLVQTNYDRDQPDPVHDPRRTPAERRMAQLGITLTKEDLLYKIMFEWPNLNIATIMTSIMIPGQSYHNTTALYGENPKVSGQMSLTVE